MERDVKDYKEWLSGLPLIYLGVVREFLSEWNRSILDADDVRYLRNCVSRYTLNTVKEALEDIIDVRVDELRQNVEGSSSNLLKVLYDVTSDEESKKIGEYGSFSWVDALSYVQLGYCCLFLNLITGRKTTLGALGFYDSHIIDESVKYMLQVMCVKYTKIIGDFKFLQVLQNEIEVSFVDDCRLYYGDSKFAGILESFKIKAYLNDMVTSKKLGLVDFLLDNPWNLVQLDKVGR